MTRRVAFLRAVNLGKRRVSMERLKAVFADLGYGGVSTYVNSGNVAFSGQGSRADLERHIGAALEKEFGFEVTTFVRTVAELTKALKVEPFDVASGDTYFVTFLKEAPSAPKAKALEALSGDFDTLVVVGRDVHWRMHGKSSDSPLVKRDWERVLGVNSSTSRNTTMLRKLVARLDS
jgi:uncharacterized protein (DUF1697 family)